MMTQAKFVKLCESVSGYDNFRAQWRVGGRSGGSCWDTGDSAYHSVEAEEEPQDWALVRLLEEHFPNISFLKYQKLLRECVKVSESKRDHDYYGNYYDYRQKEASFEDVYKFLKENNLL